MSKVNSFDDVQSGGSTFTGFPNLKLADDNDYAIVRIMHDTVDSLEIHNVHSLEINTTTGKKFYSTVDCLREANESPDKCPLCNAGYKLSTQVLIHLLEYQSDKHGNQNCSPVVWARTAIWVKNNIVSLFATYGDSLPNVLFKIVRHGKKGDQTTKYTIEAMPETLGGKPTQWTETNYPFPEENPFDGYEEVGERSNICSKSFEDMEYFLQNGNFPFGNNTNTSNANNADGERQYMQSNTEDEELPFDSTPTVPTPPANSQPWKRTVGGNTGVRRYN